MATSPSVNDDWLESTSSSTTLWQQSPASLSDSGSSSTIDLNVDTTTSYDEFFKIFSQSNLAISTTFLVRSDLDPNPSDVVFFTTDHVYFYVHSFKLLEHSKNSCYGILADLSVPLFLLETSEVANLAFHILYHLNLPSYPLILSLLARALNLLATCGIDLSSVLVPSNPFYDSILGHGIRYPLETYIVAARFSLETLAVEISKYLLTTPLYTITDEMARAMGPDYFRRLVFLHQGRTERLKELIMQPPSLHELTKDCFESDQRRLQREWRAHAVVLGWNAGPSTSTSQLYNTFLPVTEKAYHCPKCSEGARSKLRALVVDWASVSCTI